MTVGFRLLSGNTGTQTGGWFRDELKSLDDVKRRAIRTPPLLVAYGKTGVATSPYMRRAKSLFRRLAIGTLVMRLNRLAPTTIWHLGSIRLQNYYMPSFGESRPSRPNMVATRKKVPGNLPKFLQAIIS